MQHASMRVRFWGVRGSIACPGPETIRYGGNTPCIEVRCGEHILIFDAGTGLRALGHALVKDSKVRDVNIFLTHCHLDHVIGLPFFAPFFAEGYRVRIWAGNLMPPDSIEQIMRKLMSSPLFPVEVEIFKAKIEYHDFRSGDVLRPYEGVTLQTAPLDHPGWRERLSAGIWRPHICPAQRHRGISRQARPRTGVDGARRRPGRL